MTRNNLLVLLVLSQIAVMGAGVFAQAQGQTGQTNSTDCTSVSSNSGSSGPVAAATTPAPTASPAPGRSAVSGQ